MEEAEKLTPEVTGAEKIQRLSAVSHVLAPCVYDERSYGAYKNLLMLLAVEAGEKEGRLTLPAFDEKLRSKYEWDKRISRLSKKMAGIIGLSDKRSFDEKMQDVWQGTQEKQVFDGFSEFGDEELRNDLENFGKRIFSGARRILNVMKADDDLIQVYAALRVEMEKRQLEKIIAPAGDYQPEEFYKIEKEDKERSFLWEREILKVKQAASVKERESIGGMMAVYKKLKETEDVLPEEQIEPSNFANPKPTKPPTEFPHESVPPVPVVKITGGMMGYEKQERLKAQVGISKALRKQAKSSLAGGYRPPPRGTTRWEMGKTRNWGNRAR